MPVMIHGKEYLTVAERVNSFRDAHPDWTIQNSLVSADEKTVVFKAEIYNEKGRLIASGHAEEIRTKIGINRTSALEVAETSAAGRALAFFGLAGSEIASADEVAQAVRGQIKQEFVKPGDPFDTAKYSDDELSLRSCGTEAELLATWTAIYTRIKDDQGALQYLSGVKDECKAGLT